MAKQRIRDTTNPIKATGAGKARTRHKADQATPRGVITDKNSRLDRMLRPGDTSHPSQQGGATALRPGRFAETSVRKGKVVGAKREGTGLVKNARERTRTGTSRSGAQARSGVRNSRGTRTRGRRSR